MSCLSVSTASNSPVASSGNVDEAREGRGGFLSLRVVSVHVHETRPRLPTAITMSNSHTISQRTHQLCESFQRACDTTKTFPEHKRPAITQEHDIEDSFSRFRLWAGNLGAFHPAKSSKSLDYRLRKEPDVRHRLEQILTELNALLLRGQ